MPRRVVVTGIGAVTPLGLNAADSWKGIKEGVCGVAPITLFDTADYKVKLACEVKGFKAEDFMDRKDARRMDRFCQLGMAAAAEAIADSGLDLDKIDRTRFATHVGSGVGGFETMQTESVKLRDRGPMKVTPMLVPMMIIDMVGGQIAMKYGLQGPCTGIVSACATGTDAIGEAYRLVRDGYADYSIAGGTDACVTGLAVAGFSQIQALSERDDTKRASIPFDAERDGFVIGEGAGIVVLEEYESAVRRGAKIYGEIVGYGVTCDAYHMTAPSPDGEGIIRAMRLAMDEGNVRPEDIGYINAHGTSTPPNDRTETLAVKEVFGEYAKKVPISSTKSMTGHMLGATGAAEAIFCMLAMRDSFIPATIGYQVKDSECDLDYVPNAGRKAEIQYALSNSMGFGGHNAVLLMRKA